MVSVVPATAVASEAERLASASGVDALRRLTIGVGGGVRGVLVLRDAAPILAPAKLAAGTVLPTEARTIHIGYQMQYATRFWMQQAKLAIAHGLLREYETRLRGGQRYELIARLRTDDIILSHLPWSHVKAVGKSSHPRMAEPLTAKEAKQAHADSKVSHHHSQGTASAGAFVALPTTCQVRTMTSRSPCNPPYINSTRATTNDNFLTNLYAAIRNT